MPNSSITLVVQNSANKSGIWYAQVIENKQGTTILFFKREKPRSLFTMLVDKFSGITSGRRAAEKYLGTLGWQARDVPTMDTQTASHPSVYGKKPSKFSRPTADSATLGAGTQISTEAARRHTAALRKDQERRINAQLASQNDLKNSAKVMRFVMSIPMPDNSPLPDLQLENGKVNATNAHLFFEQLSERASTKGFQWKADTSTTVTLIGAERAEKQQTQSQTRDGALSSSPFSDANERKTFVAEFVKFNCERLEPEFDADDYAEQCASKLEEMIDLVLSTASGAASPTVEQKKAVDRQLSALKAWASNSGGLAEKAGRLETLWHKHAHDDAYKNKTPGP